MTALASTFDKIYTDGTWGKDKDRLGYSGPGSTLDATLEYRLFLGRLLSLLDIQSVVDAGCGDWTFSHEVGWGVATYKGFDISRVAIEKAQKYAVFASRTFEVADVTQPLPPADLLLCKDVLQHLPNSMVLDFIKNNLVPGKYKWAIITNDKGGENRDIVAGDHRHLDLSLPPFNVRGLMDLGITFGVAGGKVSQLLFLG